MNGEAFCRGKRTALSDLTNANGKRGAPLTSGKFVIGNQILKNINSGEDNARSSKRACKGPENVSKGEPGYSGSFRFKRCGNLLAGVFPENWKDGHKTGVSAVKGKQIIQSVPWNHNDEIRKGNEISSAFSPGQHFVQGHVAPHGTIQSTGGGEGLNSNVTKPQLHADDQNNSNTRECFDNDSLICHACGVENVVAYDIDGKDSETGTTNIPTFIRSNVEVTCEQLNYATTSGLRILSQESSNRPCIDASSSQPFELAGPMETNNEGVQNIPNFGSDSPPFHTGAHSSFCKDCSCSLCTRAAYIWADLLYQDARGRLAEVKKSRRQASILVGRSYVRDVGRGSTEKSSEKFKKFTNMEYDLMNRWRSLFAQTEKILQSEDTKLQEDIFKLKRFRAECRKESKMTFEVFPNKLQGTPEDSD